MKPVSSRRLELDGGSSKEITECRCAEGNPSPAPTRRKCAAMEPIGLGGAGNDDIGNGPGFWPPARSVWWWRRGSVPGTLDRCHCCHCGYTLGAACHKHAAVWLTRGTEVQSPNTRSGSGGWWAFGERRGRRGPGLGWRGVGEGGTDQGTSQLEPRKSNRNHTFMEAPWERVAY